MGFHRRYVTEEGILNAYKTNKIKGLQSYLNADAYILNGPWVACIVELYSDDQHEKVKELIKLKIDEEEFKNNS